MCQVTLNSTSSQKEQGKWAGISMSVSSVVKELQDKVRMSEYYFETTQVLLYISFIWCISLGRVADGTIH